MGTLPFLKVSYRTVRVWQRNLNVLLRLWKTETWPPFVEPILYVVALGLGLGGYVTRIEGLSFLQFLAPAFVATAGMFVSSFECLFGSFVRMEFQKTFDAALATPLNVEEVIFGEILWGGSRAVFASFGVLVIITLFGLVHSVWAVLTLPVAFIEGLMFASLAMIFTSKAPAIDSFNYYITLGLTPMFLFSGVFFPIESLPKSIQILAWFSPLTHAVSLQRALVLNRWSGDLLLDLLWMVVLTFIAANIAMHSMAQRIIK